MSQFTTVKNAFHDYVMNDLEAADPAYVREVLTDVCGLDDRGLKLVGLDAIFPEEELEILRCKE